jgi:hypothetical protein
MDYNWLKFDADVSVEGFANYKNFRFNIALYVGIIDGKTFKYHGFSFNQNIESQQSGFTSITLLY